MAPQEPEQGSWLPGSLRGLAPQEPEPGRLLPGGTIYHHPGELPFWAIWSMCLVLCCVPIWRVHRSKPNPPMDLILRKPLLHTPHDQLQA